MTNISNIYIFSEVRGDTTVKELLEGPVEELQFHQKCYDNYTHTKTLKHIVDCNDKDQQIANETIENSSSSSQRLSTLILIYISVFVFIFFCDQAHMLGLSNDESGVLFLFFHFIFCFPRL